MTVFLIKYADQIGIAASGLCLIHCLFMPFILVFWLQPDHCSSGMSCHEEHPWFNYDYLFLAFSAIAVWLASGHCTKLWLKISMWFLFSLLAFGVILEPIYKGVHDATLFAAVGLAVAHFINWRTCRQCNPPQP